MPIIDCGWFDDDGKPSRAHLRLLGPTTQVVVSLLGDPPATESDEEPRTQTVRALIDTGASVSCIDDQLAKDLGLPVVDVQAIAGSDGTADHDVYMARVSIPGLEFNEYGRFAGVHLQKGGQPQQVLLGRSFLNNTIMIYDGIRGQVTVAAARIPG